MIINLFVMIKNEVIEEYDEEKEFKKYIVIIKIQQEKKANYKKRLL